MADLIELETERLLPRQWRDCDPEPPLTKWGGSNMQNQLFRRR